jgi:hypothetical protein
LPCARSRSAAVANRVGRVQRDAHEVVRSGVPKVDDSVGDDAAHERLAEAGIKPSVGAGGSSYDSALAEIINGMYKTELIKPRKSWRTTDDVELATAEWVYWYHHHRRYEYCGDVLPIELETAF